MFLRVETDRDWSCFIGGSVSEVYRFYHQRPDLDEEPIFSGSATDPLFILTGLTPGQSYLVYASATNAGGESELSEPASAVVHLAAVA